MGSEIVEILEKRAINIWFQPIIALREGTLLGYEALTRGPSDGPLHSFINLFDAARKAGLQVVLEQVCQEIAVERFVHLGLQGNLFINVTPDTILQHEFKLHWFENILGKHHLPINRVIIELTEHGPGYDSQALCEAIKIYHARGFRIAIDDLGEGFSSFRLWLDLKPEVVKIDRFFIQGLALDPIKQEFIQSICRMAKKVGTLIVAEGIEDQADLLTTRQAGVDLGQGYYIARPRELPIQTVPEHIQTAIQIASESVVPADQFPLEADSSITAIYFLKDVPWVGPEVTNEVVFGMFENDPELFVLPVIQRGVPVGIINRMNIIDRFARPYRRELFARKPCATLMDENPLVVDGNTDIQELGKRMSAAGRRYLFDGFIITDKGKYLGMGTAQDLMQKITELQIISARYANPLTQLPGNVVVNRTLDEWLASGKIFICCYCDLNHFKPFNDRYGYDRGDKVINLLANVLKSRVDSKKEFIGHIGGDDFICLLKGNEWEARCRSLMGEFDTKVLSFFSEEDRSLRGYSGEDRKGNEVFHPLVSLAIGVLVVEPGVFPSHRELGEATATTKKMAKKMKSQTLFVERRHYNVPNKTIAER